MRAPDYVEPPLNLQEYHSPATQFRFLNTTDKDTDLLTVDGLPEGGRLRLATLDYYDGTVIQIAANASTGRVSATLAPRSTRRRCPPAPRPRT